MRFGLLIMIDQCAFKLFVEKLGEVESARFICLNADGRVEKIPFHYFSVDVTFDPCLDYGLGGRVALSHIFGHIIRIGILGQIGGPYIKIVMAYFAIRDHFFRMLGRIVIGDTIKLQGNLPF